jgi:hypothetical protein
MSFGPHCHNSWGEPVETNAEHHKDSLLAASAVTVHLPDGTVTLAVGHAVPPWLPTPAAVITAMNPSGPVEADTNRRASMAMHALFHRRDITHWPSVSHAGDGTHAETGWFITGVCVDLTCQIGRAFGQLAIYWLDDTVTVLACR